MNEILFLIMMLNAMLTMCAVVAVIFCLVSDELSKYQLGIAICAVVFFSICTGVTAEASYRLSSYEKIMNNNNIDYQQEMFNLEKKSSNK